MARGALLQMLARKYKNAQQKAELAMGNAGLWDVVMNLRTAGAGRAFPSFPSWVLKQRCRSLFNIVQFSNPFQSETSHPMQSSFHSFHNSHFTLAPGHLLACCRIRVARCFFFSNTRGEKIKRFRAGWEGTNHFRPN